MAITAANATYEGQGPSASGQVLVQGGLPGSVSQTLIGFATLILDGTLTTAVVNFIDGTATLPFTPSAVLAFNGGAGTAGATNAVLTVSAITTTGFTLNFSAGSNAQTLKIVFIVFK